MTAKPANRLKPRPAAAEGRPTPTRERLLLSTERLVGEFGVDGVSTRQISADAGVELASIHHHFGTKDQMILAVRLWRVGMIEEALHRLMDVHCAAGRPTTARDLAVFLVRPFADLAFDPENEARHYPTFLRALSNCRRLGPQIAVDTQWTRSLLDVYAEVRPDLSANERRRRFALTASMAIGAVTGGTLHVWMENTMPGAAEGLLGTLLDCVTAALDA